MVVRAMPKMVVDPCA